VGRVWRIGPDAGLGPDGRRQENGEALLGFVEERLAARFFLRCLYLVSGDAVRSTFNTTDRRRLEQLVSQALGSSDPWVVTWARRTQTLVADPETFDYTAWCDGGLAADPVGP